MKPYQSSPFDACDRTRATSLLRVKNSTRHFCLWHSLVRILDEEIERTKKSDLVVDNFSLTFVKPLFNLCLT